MLQIKIFKLNDKETEAISNKWLKENYSKIQMRADGKGPNISVFGTTEPSIMIQYDTNEKHSKEFIIEALNEERSMRRSKLVLSLQQLEEHRSKLQIVPMLTTPKGKQTPVKTAAYIAHEDGINITKRDILLQKSDIAALDKMIINIDAVVDGVLIDEESVFSEKEKEIAEKVIS